MVCDWRVIGLNLCQKHVSEEQLFWIGLSGLDSRPPCNPLAFAVPASPPQRRYDREDELAENRIIVQCGEYNTTKRGLLYYTYLLPQPARGSTTETPGARASGAPPETARCTCFQRGTAPLRQLTTANAIPHKKFPPPAVYALPTTGVNHVRISGYNRYGCCCGRLSQWQCAAPAVVSRAEWVALHAHHVRVAQFGVRQHGCRASRAHDPARGTPIPLQVTEVLDVLVPIIESIRHACDTCA